MQETVPPPFWSADIVTALATVGALITTAVTLWLQRKHNRKSVIPVGQIVLGNYDDFLDVSISNKGIGPLIIRRFVFRCGGKEWGDIYKQMPELPEGMYWTTYTGDITNRCLSPGEKLGILQLKGDHEDPKFVAFRDSVRATLAPCSVSFSVTDVYDSKLPAVERSLDWFKPEQPVPAPPNQSLQRSGEP